MRRGDRNLALHAPQCPALSIGAKGQLATSHDVLVLVDVINPLDFPGSEKLSRPAWLAARAIHLFRRHLDARGVPTIYANDNYGVWRSDFRDILAHCMKQAGASGDIARLLAPRPHDLVLLKPRHSAFFSTPLNLVLTQMGAKRLILAGLAADICVQLTAMDATLHGYALWVPSDCTAAESPRSKAASLAYMSSILKADVKRSSAVNA